MRSFGAAAATLSVAFLVAGLVWPHVAASLLQGLLATLALGYVGARAYRSGLPESLASDLYSPFGGVPSDKPPSSSPEAIRNLTVLMSASGDRDTAERAAIPAAAERIVAAEASRRLAEHHGLSVLEPGDHRRIQALLSEMTWALIRPDAPGARGLAHRDSVSLSHLGSIMDDVEQL